jgi:hypothetical protein
MEVEMKNLAWAIGIVVLAMALGSNLLAAIGVEKSNALQLGEMLLGGIVFVHQVLEKREIKLNLRALPKGVVTFEGFSLPWYQMLVYGTLIFAALKQFGGLIGGLTAGFAGVSSSGGALLAIAIVVANLVAIVGVYAICFWIGTRCDKYSYLVAIAVPLLGHVIGASIDFLALSASEFSNFFGQPKSASFFLQGVIVGTLIVVIFALLGVWRGRRARLSAYLSYLLGILPPDTRNTIVDLTYEEVKALSSKPSNTRLPSVEPFKS